MNGTSFKFLIGDLLQSGIDNEMSLLQAATPKNSSRSM